MLEDINEEIEIIEEDGRDTLPITEDREDD